MKRLSSEDRQRQIRLQELREKHRLARMGPKRTLRRVKISGHNLLTVPQYFSLYEDTQFEQAMELIIRLRELLNTGDTVLLDFRSTTRVTAAAMLRLQAEISTWHRYHNRILVRKTSGASTAVSAMLENSGFLKELEAPASSSSRPRLLTMRTGTTAEGHLLDITRTMNDCFYSGELSEQEQANLYGGINEAMLNVFQHAYTGTETDLEKQLGKRWWIYAQQVETQLFLAFFDRGVGIPTTLPYHDQWERIQFGARKLLGSDHDSALIQAAMELGRSEFKTPGHGQGLQDILRFVEENPEGILWIFSRRGLYKYDKEVDKHVLRDYPTTIGGTLIQWNVSLRRTNAPENSKR